ncbi:MAG: methionyl-tRNA formyltransferase [Gammaproteobacteria bacterium CG11_big_fil_rev_8_21_14_0_20_46_22]|nr:MAG: methionyl-tRNA formyltransferase [Gammaproteobacteria bacterium CG12_big_fil_rev_8_21_14_0_65_46_12]PIR10657.1 MAG: methionyl-tRNA formyltransferase [Gammaproteobacteria bacterium CG11_big_fil_rev_8_21_14_0_20_46_22]
MSIKRVVFCGTPEFAALHLQAVLSAGFEVAAVFTQPDRPAGRGRKLAASPVKQLALRHGIEVYQPERLRGDREFHDELMALKPDLMIVVAYGLILPESFLFIPRYGSWNVHASLLPRWRGAAPIQRAILAGDTQSGVTIMQMDAGLDTGDMLLKKTCDIADHDTGGSLHDRLANLGSQALLEAIANLESLVPEAQDDNQSSYAKKLNKAEARLDWAQSAECLDRQVRAFNPWPVSEAYVKGERFRVLEAYVVPTDKQAVPGTVLSVDKTGVCVACGERALNLSCLQLPGKRAMPVSDLINGQQLPFSVGDVLDA